ncbi:MAG TPA: glucokinase [Pyrinomonadaceae bacterium]|nr:glucokinase [Pyrinomonadaceae bacterium]
MIIAGDIGGTKTNVALFEGGVDGRGAMSPVAQKSFPSGAYDSLEAILGEFVGEHRPRLDAACFGVAGPVADGRVETTSLAWTIYEKSLAGLLKLERVRLINDLEATAYGLDALAPAQLYTLNEGHGPRHGHRALVAAGTGLGMAGIYWGGKSYHPIPSEGGHIDFAPHDEQEDALLRYMRERVGGRVSYERVLSGPGLVNIHSFLADTEYRDVRPAVDASVEEKSKAAAISAAALARECPVAVEALDMFVEIYGALAGDLALVLKPDGGLYVGGGIAPKILEKLKDGRFMRAFTDKGRMSFINEATPVRVILDDKTALYGAALCALGAQR